MNATHANMTLKEIQIATAWWMITTAAMTLAENPSFRTPIHTLGNKPGWEAGGLLPRPHKGASAMQPMSMHEQAVRSRALFHARAHGSPFMGTGHGYRFPVAEEPFNECPVYEFDATPRSDELSLTVESLPSDLHRPNEHVFRVANDITVTTNGTDTLRLDVRGAVYYPTIFSHAYARATHGPSWWYDCASTPAHLTCDEVINELTRVVAQWVRVTEKPMAHTRERSKARLRIAFADSEHRLEPGDVPFNDNTLAHANAHYMHFNRRIVYATAETTRQQLARARGGYVVKPHCYYRLEQVALHEMGHTLGLGHNWHNQSALMFPTTSRGARKTITDSDSFAMRWLHGFYKIETDELGDHASVPEDGVEYTGTVAERREFADRCWEMLGSPMHEQPSRGDSKTRELAERCAAYMKRNAATVMSEARRRLNVA